MIWYEWYECVCVTGRGQPSVSFATLEAAQQEGEAPPIKQQTQSALLHARRARDKPSKNRNAWKRAEKKALQMRVRRLY